MPADQQLRDNYRSTWLEYSRKLDVLQHLSESDDVDRSRIEFAVLDLEKARLAHSAARDRLAGELDVAGRLESFHAAALSEASVRETADLLWELGRPQEARRATGTGDR